MIKLKAQYRSVIIWQLLSALIVLMVTIGSLVGFEREAEALFEPHRISGQDRFETAVEIGNLIHLRTVVYLSRSDKFADALAAGSLEDGRILLVPPCGEIPKVVSEAIERWKPEKVVALGGQNAICDSTLELAANGLLTDRISGVDRVHTAVEISKRRYEVDSPEEIYLTTAEESPDALAMGMSRKGPILLVGEEDPPPQALVDEIARHSSAKIVVVGGESAVPNSRVSKLIGSRPFQRIRGENRYETAVEITKYLFPTSPPDSVYLARGDTYVDAVAGASAPPVPLLLVPSCGPVPAAVIAEVQRLQPERVVALGGESAICSQVLRDLTTGKGSGGHGYSAPQSVTLWESEKVAGHRLTIYVPNADQIYFGGMHPNTCQVLGISYTGPEDCNPILDAPVWRYSEEISVDGGSTVCWVWKSESDWNRPKDEWEVTYLGPQAAGLYHDVYRYRSWRNPCWGQFPALPSPPIFKVRLTFSDLERNESDVSPWITVDASSLRVPS